MHSKLISTLRWAVLTILWIGFCHTGPISLCIDSFVFISVYIMFSSSSSNSSTTSSTEDKRTSTAHCMHSMQRCLATRKLSVRPSVCQMRDLWLNERNVCQHSYITWKIIHASFVTRRMIGGDDLFYLKFWTKLPLLERKRWFSTIDVRS